MTSFNQQAQLYASVVYSLQPSLKILLIHDSQLCHGAVASPYWSMFKSLIDILQIPRPMLTLLITYLSAGELAYVSL